MVLLRAFQNWQKARSEGYERNFSETNFISTSTMEMIVGLRAQLLGQLRAAGFVRARGNGDIRDLNTNSENWAVVKAALCAGAYPNLIRIDRQRRQLITQKESKVRFHPSSVLMTTNTTNQRDGGGNAAKYSGKDVDNYPSDWFIYEEMTRIGRVSYARTCTILSPITVSIFAGPARLPSDHLIIGNGAEEDDDSLSEDEMMAPESALLKIDDWLAFKTTPEIASLVIPLRQKWHALFLRRMESPLKSMSSADDMVIKTIVQVLTSQEQALGLQQPVGVGQRPRPMTSDYCPPVSNTLMNSPGQRNVSSAGRPQQQQPGRQGGGRSPRNQQQQQQQFGDAFAKPRSTKRY